MEEDNSGIKYANFIGIIKLIGIYIDKHPDKVKFSPYAFTFKKNLSANDIIKKDLHQMILLAEFIILLTGIGTNKVKYLERISDSDEKICNIYFTVIEKYILVESESIIQSKNNIYEKANSNINNNSTIDKDKKSLIQLVKEQDQKLNEYIQQIKDLKNEKELLENNLKEKELILEKKQNITKEATNELITNNILLTQLQTENKEKNITIESLKSELNFIQKKEKEKIYKLEEENINLKNNMKNIKDIEDKYEQLMMKYKRLKESFQEKEKERIDELPSKIQLMNDIDDLKQKNEFLLKANDALKNEITKINQNSLLDKEKIKQLEIENKKINYEKNELNEKLLKLRGGIQKEKKEKEEQISTKGITLDKILEEDNESQIGKKSKIENLLFENENLKKKITTINQEKQKLGLDLQKCELDNKKLVLTLDRIKNESKRYSDDNKCLNDKITDINKLKKKDLDKLKKEIDDKVKIIEKMLQEKKEMIKNYELLQKELLQTKNNNNSYNNKKNINNNQNIIKEVIISNSENLELKNEIQNLNLLLLQKDEEIRKLKDERQLTDDEVNLKLADLDFYKKLYEEQKLRVNKEHELISESLYKLAVHFMSLKDDLQKKIKNK